MPAYIDLLYIFSYIKEMEGAGLKIVAASDPNYMRTLESVIRVGEAMLLKVMEIISQSKIIVLTVLFSNVKCYRIVLYILSVCFRPLGYRQCQQCHFFVRLVYC